jgi:hypothetical protein
MNISDVGGGASPRDRLPADAQRAYDIMVQACPLNADAYPEKLRQDLLEAIAGVAAAQPTPPQPPQPRFSVVAHPDGGWCWRRETDGKLGPRSAQADAAAAAAHLDRFPSDANDRELPDTAPKVVTLAGYAQTGKDVYADYAEGTFRGIRRFAFSDAIIADANEWTVPAGHELAQSNKTLPHYRRLLEMIGVCGRYEDPQYTAAASKRRVAEMLTDPNVSQVIVTGARAPIDQRTGRPDVNDFEGVRAMGGKVLRVKRLGTGDADDGQPTTAGLKEIDDEYFDAVIYNAVEGDLDAYHENVEALLHGRPQPWTKPLTAQQAALKREQRAALTEMTRTAEETGDYC